MGKSVWEIRREHQMSLFGGAHGQGEGSVPKREKKEALRLQPTPSDCCGEPMIPCWFRNKFKGYVCHTGTPMHWLGIRQLTKMGYFQGRKQRDRTKLTKLLLKEE